MKMDVNKNLRCARDFMPVLSILLALGADVKSALGNVRHANCRLSALHMLPSNLFRRKTIDNLMGETIEPHQQLKRTLGPVYLTLLGVGAIIGAGIFSTVGTAAAGAAAEFSMRTLGRVPPSLLAISPNGSFHFIPPRPQGRGREG
jgi:hypothetical protein